MPVLVGHRRAVLLLGFAAMAAVPVSACRGCTVAGCHSGFSVRAFFTPADAATARACIGTTCEARPVGDTAPSGFTIGFALPDEFRREGPYRVTLEFSDAAGNVVRHEEQRVRFTKHQPNGSACEPTCWLGRADFV